MFTKYWLKSCSLFRLSLRESRALNLLQTQKRKNTSYILRIAVHVLVQQTCSILLVWLWEPAGLYQGLQRALQAAVSSLLLLSVGWRAQLRQCKLSPALVRGRLQVVEMAQQSSLGRRLHFIAGQEADDLLRTPGVALAGSWRAAGAVSRLLLVLPSQEANCHLQDVGFLLLGAGIVAVELWAQERLELLNAAVDSVSAHLLHHWLSQLQEENRKNVNNLTLVQDTHGGIFTQTWGHLKRVSGF